MNTISQALSLSEQIADKYGDGHCYHFDYLKFREHNGILRSMESALKVQGLWDIFKSNCDSEFYDKYFT